MPYIKEFLSLQNYLTTGQYAPNKTNPGTTPYPGPALQVAGFNPEEQAAFGALTGSAGTQGQLAGQTASTANDILSGKFLNPSSNPELTAYYNAAAQPLTAQYSAATAPGQMSQAALSGAFGGSSDAEARALGQYNFGNQLSNLAANIYEPAYQQGLNQITQTAALSPSIAAEQNTAGNTLLGVGGVQQQQQQADINAAYQNQYNTSMWPYELSSFLGGSFGDAGLGYGRQAGTTTSSGGFGNNKGQGLLGGALTGGTLASLLGAGTKGTGLGSIGGALAGLLL